MIISYENNGQFVTLMSFGRVAIRDGTITQQKSITTAITLSCWECDCDYRVYQKYSDCIVNSNLHAIKSLLSQITTTKIFVIDCNWSQRIPQVIVKHLWGKTFAVGIAGK